MAAEFVPKAATVASMREDWALSEFTRADCSESSAAEFPWVAADIPDT
jgi:hypothetical protein